MANVHTNNKGFGLVGFLIVVVVFIGLVSSGYYVYSKNASKTSLSTNQEDRSTAGDKAKSISSTDRSKDAQGPESYKSVISFKDNGSLTEAQKDEIRVKLAEPLSFYHFNNLNIPLKQVSVQKAETQGYTLSYVYAEDPQTNKFGFVFNPEDVRYWQPQLCDHGGCNPYPESLKKAYPANYKVYEACRAAEGDKEKLSSLGCDYVN